MATTTGGPPSLETIAQLTRTFLNDWQRGASNTPGEGQITTDDPNQSPQTLPALNSAIRWVYRKLRNVGDARLIRDNVQVALPANGATGPAVQTYLAFNGYFDGLTLQASPTLPADLLFPIELWEQQTSSILNLPFVPMVQPQYGLPSRNQTFALGEWEWREQPSLVPGNNVPPVGIFFLGALSPITVRIRYMAALTQFSALLATDYPNTYVPIMDSEEAIAYRAAYIIGAALSGMTPGVTMLKEESEAAIQDLRNTVVRRQQTVEYHREPYQSNVRAGYTTSNNLI